MVNLAANSKKRDFLVKHIPNFYPKFLIYRHSLEKLFRLMIAMFILNVSFPLTSSMLCFMVVFNAVTLLDQHNDSGSAGCLPCYCFYTLGNEAWAIQTFLYNHMYIYIYFIIKINWIIQYRLYDIVKKSIKHFATLHSHPYGPCSLAQTESFAVLCKGAMYVRTSCKLSTHGCQGNAKAMPVFCRPWVSHNICCMAYVYGVTVSKTFNQHLAEPWKTQLAVLLRFSVAFP